MSAQPTVFVIDDDRLAPRSVCALVSSLRVASEEFSSVEEFLERCDLFRPGCVVVDVRMPGLERAARDSRQRLRPGLTDHITIRQGRFEKSCPDSNWR